jgi:hypothetical protein
MYHLRIRAPTPGVESRNKRDSYFLWKHPIARLLLAMTMTVVVVVVMMMTMLLNNTCIFCCGAVWVL